MSRHRSVTAVAVQAIALSACAQVVGLDLDGYSARPEPSASDASVGGNAGQGGFVVDASNDIQTTGGSSGSSGYGGSTGGTSGASGYGGSTGGTAGAREDAGIDCGGSCGGEPRARTVCVPSEGCVAAKRVFVIAGANETLGDFGIEKNADDRCNDFAVSTASGPSLGGSWKAWISYSKGSPLARFDHNNDTLEYRLLDGTRIASGWTSLVAGLLEHPINVDRSGGKLASAVFVWTGTGENGSSAGTGDCNDFTSASDMSFAAIGNTGEIDWRWTNAKPGSCEYKHAFYCFEQ